jgi:hypothetical protein
MNFQVKNFTFKIAQNNFSDVWTLKYCESCGIRGCKFLRFTFRKVTLRSCNCIPQFTNFDFLEKIIFFKLLSFVDKNTKNFRS